MHIYNCILQAKAFYAGFVFQEKPIGNAEFYGMRPEQGVLVMIPDQGSFQVHAVEEWKIYAFDWNFCMQVFRDPFCNSSDEPVLNRHAVDQNSSKNQHND